MEYYMHNKAIWAAYGCDRTESPCTSRKIYQKEKNTQKCWLDG